MDCKRRPLAPRAEGAATSSEDAASIATGDSQWLFVGEDQEGTEVDHLEVEEAVAEDAAAAEAAAKEEAAATETAAAVAAALEATAAEIASVVAAAVEKASVPAVSAAFLHAGLELRGVLEEHAGHRGDVTAQWQEALKGFEDVKGAYCLGRLCVAQAALGAQGAAEGDSLAAISRVIVRNDGCDAWPAACALRLVAGAGWGFHELRVGALPPGQAAEFVFDVALPTGIAALGAGCGERSAWVLEDGRGRPFGPLLVLEAVGA